MARCASTRRGRWTTTGTFTSTPTPSTPSCIGVGICSARTEAPLITLIASWQYVRSDTGYVLSVTMPNTSLSYRSGEDYRQLLREAGVP